MTVRRVYSIGMLMAYLSFLAIFSTTFFVQEIMNGSWTGQLLLTE